MPNTQPLDIVHLILSGGFAGSERSTAESCNQQRKDHRVTLIVRKNHRRHDASIVDLLPVMIARFRLIRKIYTVIISNLRNHCDQA
jgi:hypothetical protein